MTRSRPVLPYRVLPIGAVLPQATGWSIIADGVASGVLTDGAPFTAWDGRLDFRLEREFEIEVPLADALGVRPVPGMFELIVIGASAGGLYREVLSRQEIAENDPSSVRVTVQPRSDRLAKDLALTTGIFLARVGSPRDSLAPIVVGSRIWEMTESFRLEGGAARLPIYEVPFSKVFPGQEMGSAEFHVEMADEPDLDFEAGITVYVNSERTDFIADLNKGGPAEMRLWTGIIRRSLVSATISSDLLQDGPGDGETVSGTLARWARQVWPHTPVARLQDLAKSDFSKFETQIESWVHRVAQRKSGGAG